MRDFDIKVHVGKPGDPDPDAVRGYIVVQAFATDAAMAVAVVEHLFDKAESVEVME